MDDIRHSIDSSRDLSNKAIPIVVICRGIGMCLPRYELLHTSIREGQLPLPMCPTFSTLSITTSQSKVTS
ncbi:hypothetical protein KUCAC02_003191 [Chaenocephalus aceratus]|uniref:Uncharacterized protein n=1 Tax=Chaenocephalus aceratus TaxID=36190 RepID=A0ACB9WLF2_CHAAC|nr:hypothetical protein KUCAC02_003191 [Chaenocephalus aceratus]